MKREFNWFTKGWPQKPSDTPLVKQFLSSQKCVTKEVSTVYFITYMLLSACRFWYDFLLVDISNTSLIWWLAKVIS